MSLIRNGGFERGNTDFWAVESGGLLDIDAVNQTYGAYCGKFTAAGDVSGDILSKDYIKVIPYQILDTVGWVKSTVDRKVYPIIYAYDADFSHISQSLGRGAWLGGSNIKFHSQFMIPEGCAYIRFGYRIQFPSADEIFYIDGVNVDILTPECKMSGVVNLLPYGSYTSSGDTSTDKKDMKQYNQYIGQLICITASGTSPTLDVSVYEIDDGENEIEIASFTQVTTAGTELIDLPHMVGNGVYIKYTIGGTSPNFIALMSVVGKG